MTRCSRCNLQLRTVCSAHCMSANTPPVQHCRPTPRHTCCTNPLLHCGLQQSTARLSLFVQLLTFQRAALRQSGGQSDRYGTRPADPVADRFAELVKIASAYASIACTRRRCIVLVSELRAHAAVAFARSVSGEPLSAPVASL